MRMRTTALASVLVLAAATLAIASTEITPPQVTATAAPVYPPAAKAARIEGAVTLAAELRADGTFGEVLVVDCDRPKLGFEDAAIAALRAWRFVPADDNGQPVSSAAMVTMHFRRQVGAAGGGDGFVRSIEALMPQRNPALGFRDVVRVATGSAGGGGNATAGTPHADVLRRIQLPNPNASGMYDRRFLVPTGELVTLPNPVTDGAGAATFGRR
jgi:TonB family protein